jgi:hypothetical protein
MVKLVWELPENQWSVVSGQEEQAMSSIRAFAFS